MKPDLRADYKIRLYTGPKNPFFEVSTFINLDHAEEGSVRLAGPMDAFAKSAVDPVDGVTVKPCQLGCLQSCQISGEAAKDLPNFALGQVRPF